MAFVVLEGHALLKGNNETLSEHAWSFQRIREWMTAKNRRPGKGKSNGLSWRRIVMGVFMTWLWIHMLFGTMTLSNPLPW
ncbi:hypothetical protein [Longimycelium tulufanense]|nr:hypothetical protein [Longimycelium tulufanense]